MTTTTKYTVGYLAYLAWQRNQDLVKKNSLYQEAQSWKSQKYGGRADVCFDIYGDLKIKLSASLPHLKEVAKNIQCKLMFDNDYTILGIEQRQSTGWITVAKNATEVQRLAEDYIVEHVILGASDAGSKIDIANSDS